MSVDTTKSTPGLTPSQGLDELTPNVANDPEKASADWLLKTRYNIGADLANLLQNDPELFKLVFEDLARRAGAIVEADGNRIVIGFNSEPPGGGGRDSDVDSRKAQEGRRSDREMGNRPFTYFGLTQMVRNGGEIRKSKLIKELNACGYYKGKAKRQAVTAALTQMRIKELISWRLGSHDPILKLEQGGREFYDQLTGISDKALSKTECKELVEMGLWLGEPIN